MPAAVVLGDQLEILVADISVDVLVLDAHVREMHLLVEVRKVVFLRPLFDFVLVTIGPSVTVGTVTIAFLEKPLVLALQLTVELHAQNAGVALPEPFGCAEIGAIELGVMSPLAMLIDARVERLTLVWIAVPAVRFQQAPAPLS